MIIGMNRPEMQLVNTVNGNKVPQKQYTDARVDDYVEFLQVLFHTHPEDANRTILLRRAGLLD